MIKFPAIRTVDDLEAFEQSFAVSFDLMELRAAIFHICDAYRSMADAPGEDCTKVAFGPEPPESDRMNKMGRP